jgi:ABC-type amino acid transport substrate-binding protein
MNKARLFALLCAAMLLAVPFWGNSAGAQSQAEGGVTAFTDGLAYPNGEISRAITELAVELDESRKFRLLPMMGSAGVANVRDLLRFRGADFAIVNNDVFALKEVFELYPEALEKLRYITKLTSQKVVLLARRDINAVDQLSGKKVLVFGPEAIAQRSASTIFDLLEVNAAITPAPDAGADGQIGDAAAIFLFHTDTSWLPRDLAQSGEFHLIPVPMNDALSAFYQEAEIKPGELGAYSGSEAIATIKTDTILATFDWLPRHGRYADVTAFIDGFFAAIPKFRGEGRLPIWHETDPQAEVPGWKQHAYAATVKGSVPRPEVEPGPFAATTESAESDSTALRLSIVSQPPLTNQQSDDGGLLTELAKAALERTAWPGAGDIAVRWDENRVDQANGIVTKKAADLALPWIGGGCEASENPGSETAFFCESIMASDPIFKVLVAFFVRADSDFDPTAEEHMIGRTICRPAELDLTPLSELSKQLIRDGKLTLVRPPSLIDCLSLVDREEADALFVNELEGKLVITHLGLSDRFRMIEGAVSVQDIHIGLASDRPGAKELLAALNEGINKLKAEDIYSQIIVKHLSPAPKLGAAQ